MLACICNEARVRRSDGSGLWKVRLCVLLLAAFALCSMMWGCAGSRTTATGEPSSQVASQASSQATGESASKVVDKSSANKMSEASVQELIDASGLPTLGTVAYIGPETVNANGDIDHLEFQVTSMKSDVNDFDFSVAESGICPAFTTKASIKSDDEAERTTVVRVPLNRELTEGFYQVKATLRAPNGKETVCVASVKVV